MDSLFAQTLVCTYCTVRLFEYCSIVYKCTLCKVLGIVTLLYMLWSWKDVVTESLSLNRFLERRCH